MTISSRSIREISRASGDYRTLFRSSLASVTAAQAYFGVGVVDRPLPVMRPKGPNEAVVETWSLSLTSSGPFRLPSSSPLPTSPSCCSRSAPRSSSRLCPLPLHRLFCYHVCCTYHFTQHSDFVASCRRRTIVQDAGTFHVIFSSPSFLTATTSLLGLSCCRRW